jgi:hypothetical protein
VRATLTLGVAASVVANVLHARDNPISQAIAAWPPLALLLTVELISRVPVHRRSLAITRLVATATIAGIAAWVSYWHMVGVAARYGETGASPYLLPLSVDGLIVVASICLVELGGRISTIQSTARTAVAGDAGVREALDDAPALAAADPPVPGTESDGALQPLPTPATGPAGVPATPVAGPAAVPAGAGSPVIAMAGFHPTATKSGIRPNRSRTTAGATGKRTTAGSTASRTAAGATGKRTTAGSTASRTAAGQRAGKATKVAARPRRPVAETAALAAAIEADRPHASEMEVARELGITLARLRAVRRQTRDLDLAA